MDDIVQLQKAVCVRCSSPFVESPSSLKVGIARNVRSGALPINGLWHQPEGDTTGWYIWAGEELSEDPDFLFRFTLSISPNGVLLRFPILVLRRGGGFLLPGSMRMFGKMTRCWGNSMWADRLAKAMLFYYCLCGIVALVLDCCAYQLGNGFQVLSGLSIPVMKWLLLVGTAGCLVSCIGYPKSIGWRLAAVVLLIVFAYATYSLWVLDSVG